MNLFRFILNYKNRKNYIKNCADVETDVVAMKMRHHVAVYVHATWRTRKHARPCD